MAANNVKTVFRLPSGVNEGSMRNLIWQHHHQQQHQKISANKQQQKYVSNIHRKRSVLQCLFNKVSGLQPTALSKKRLRYWRFPVKLLGTHFFIEHLRTTASGRAQDFTKNVPNTNS